MQWDAAQAKAAAIREAEQRVLKAASTLPTRVRVSDLRQGASPLPFKELFNAMGDLKALGWEPKL